MDTPAFLKDKDFMRTCLISSAVISSASILLNLLGFLQVIAIQIIASILIIASYGILLFLGQLIYLNVNDKSERGAKVKKMTHGLNLLLALSPLLVGLTGSLSSAVIYLIIPVSFDGNILPIILALVNSIGLLSNGLILSVYCYLNLEDSHLWTF